MISSDFSLARSIASLRRQQAHLFRQANLIGVHTDLFARHLYLQEYQKLVAALDRLLRLRVRFSHSRLEAACQRASFYGSSSFDTLTLILRHRLDRLPLSPQSDIFGQLFLDFQDE